VIISAQRCPRLHRPSRSQKPGIVLGLRYERRFQKSLQKAITETDFQIEFNPWFSYVDDIEGPNACSPDVLLHDPSGRFIIVIEVKYTWISSALPKLTDLYCPVVTKALNKSTVPLVVVKRLSPEAPKPLLDWREIRPPHLFQWLETTPLRF